MNATEIKAKAYEQIFTIIRDSSLWEYATDKEPTWYEYAKALLYNITGILDLAEAMIDEAECDSK